MSTWFVVKTGETAFDFLHAAGLGIGLANAVDDKVELSDQGLFYQLTTASCPPTTVDLALFIKIIRIPEAVELDKIQDETRLDNLDGLLAALFTVPGVRAVSVTDLLRKERAQPGTIQEGLRKVQKTIARWCKYMERRAKHSGSWFNELLTEYSAAQMKIPKPVRTTDSQISILMTLEPAFAYATRRPLSDGYISDKTNVAIADAHYATILAFVGAARFLRAQRTGSDLVNFYTPLAQHLVLRPDTAQPRLPPFEGQCWPGLTRQWLQQWQAQPYQWHALTFQILQTQGAKQSVSRWRGVLPYAWLDQVATRVSPKIVRYWLHLLGKRSDNSSLDLDSLVDFLLNPCEPYWLAYLHDFAIYLYGPNKSNLYRYSINEVKEIIMLLHQPSQSPLRSVLAHEAGTLRFGHALRLLGKQNRSALRDVADELAAVHTRDDLIRTLVQAVQACHLASAHTQFIVIPTDDDLTYLLDDVEQFGAKEIASLLMLLAILHYPARADGQTSAELAPDEVTDNLETINNEEQP